MEAMTQHVEDVHPDVQERFWKEWINANAEWCDCVPVDDVAGDEPIYIQEVLDVKGSGSPTRHPGQSPSQPVVKLTDSVDVGTLTPLQRPPPGEVIDPALSVYDGLKDYWRSIDEARHYFMRRTGRTAPQGFSASIRITDKNFKPPPPWEDADALKSYWIEVEGR